MRQLLRFLLIISIFFILRIWWWHWRQLRPHVTSTMFDKDTRSRRPWFYEALGSLQEWALKHPNDVPLIAHRSKTISWTMDYVCTVCMRLCVWQGSDLSPALLVATVCYYRNESYTSSHEEIFFTFYMLYVWCAPPPWLHGKSSGGSWAM